MAQVQMVCPKCQQPIEPHEFTFSTNGKLVTLQKCPACEYEWVDLSRSSDRRNSEEQKPTRP
jgi:hypothetical protein